MFISNNFDSKVVGVAAAKEIRLRQNKGTKVVNVNLNNKQGGGELRTLYNFRGRINKLHSQ